MRMSWQVFHDWSLFWDLFGGLSWRSWSIVQQFGPRLPIHILNKLLNRVFRGAGFLAGCDLECYLAHRRSVAVLGMRFKIKSNPMNPVSCALPLPYVPACVARGALVAHRHSFAPRCCRTTQYRRTFVEYCFVEYTNDLVTLYLRDWRFLRAEPMFSCWPNLLFIYVKYCGVFFFLSWVDCVGFGVFGLIECSHYLPTMHCWLYFNNNNNNNNNNCTQNWIQCRNITLLFFTMW